MNQKATKGTGFKNRKKLKIDWVGVAVSGVLIVVVTIIITLIVQLSPRYNDPGQDTPRSPEPGSSVSDTRVEYHDGPLWVMEDDGSHDLILPLPPISLQQVYYDPWTSKLWYIDDDGIPHEITIAVTIDAEVGLDHEFEGRE